jgi:hypothetical protein
VIRACGALDSRYGPTYGFKDVDYCFEARLRGFQLLQVPVALQHQESQTMRSFFENPSQLHEDILRNSKLFYDKWRPFAAALGVVPKSIDLRLCEEALFNRDGRGVGFLVQGWSHPESWGVWSDSSFAKLRFHLSPTPAGKVVLRIQLKAFLPAESSVREIDVSIANKLIERWRFDPGSPSGERRLVVPQETIGSDGALEIGFHILNPESPAEFGLSGDDRKLGIGLVSLIVDAQS